MGILLNDADELCHPPGSQNNWNESRYVDFWDRAQRLGGWFRIGNRPNEGRAEVSACINLPDGRAAVMFTKPTIAANTLKSGDLGWDITKSWDTSTVRYRGHLLLLDDAWQLTEPKQALTSAPRVQADIELVVHSRGLASIMGFDQSHVDLILLPGQADFHYQNLISVTGTIVIGSQSWRVAGRGGADHSWGPRNWHAKQYLRWLIASVDEDHGFMLMRSVGPSKQTRSGFVWDAGRFHLVDDFVLHNEYAAPPHYELRTVSVSIASGERRWTALGKPQHWLPLRHRQIDARGNPALLRIVKSPTEWIVDGHPGAGMCEWHDLIVDGKPVGLQD